MCVALLPTSHKHPHILGKNQSQEAYEKKGGSNVSHGCSYKTEGRGESQPWPEASWVPQGLL